MPSSVALSLIVVLAALVPGRGSAACSSDELAVYRVFLDTHWSRDAFPKQYPEWRPPAGWSKMVGRTHDDSYWLFREGEMASPGLQVFAEKGHSDSLEAADHAGVYDEFTAPPVARGVGRTVADFFLDGNHSLVSVAARVVPSPDWFIGVDSLDLCRDNHWIDSIAIDVDPMDAGTDNGFTFTAPNWPSEPKEPVARITSKRPSHPANSFYYPKLDKLPSIATLTFVKCRPTSGGPCVRSNATASAVASATASTTSTTTSTTTPATEPAPTITTPVAGDALSKLATTPATTNITTASTSTATPAATSPTSASARVVRAVAAAREPPATTTAAPNTTQSAAPTTTQTAPTESTATATDTADTDPGDAQPATPQGSAEITSPAVPPEPANGTVSTAEAPQTPAVAASTATSSPTPAATVQPAASTAPPTPAYALSERSAGRCRAACAQQIPANTPTFAQTEMDDIDDLLEERVYHLSMELSRNASQNRDAVVDGNDISNDLSPGLGAGLGGNGLDSTESAIRRTSKARRSRKGSRQAKNCRVSEWSPWSSCSVSCGVGDATRTRRVLEHPRRGGQPCPALQERRWCGGHSECPQNFFNW